MSHRDWISLANFSRSLLAQPSFFRITDISLCFRSYEDTGEQSIVLRELRAAAAMDVLDPEGRELMLCYEDSGGERVSAGWIAR